MATPRTLTERLEAIINSADATPLKGRLIRLLRSVKLLENGRVARKKETEIAGLKAQNEDLKIQLRAVQAEIDQYRAEQAQEHEKKREVDPTQLKILRKLPSKYGGKPLDMRQIGVAASVRVDEAEVYVEGLEELALVEPVHGETEGTTWRRTLEGNKLVVAKRWAGEEEPEDKTPKRSQHGELTHPHEVALLMMAETDEGVTEEELAKALDYTKPMALYIFVSLETHYKMAVLSQEPDYGTGQRWKLLRKGLEHLVERRLV